MIYKVKQLLADIGDGITEREGERERVGGREREKEGEIDRQTEKGGWEKLD